MGFNSGFKGLKYKTGWPLTSSTLDVHATVEQWNWLINLSSFTETGLCLWDLHVHCRTLSYLEHALLPNWNLILWNSGCWTLPADQFVVSFLSAICNVSSPLFWPSPLFFLCFLYVSCFSYFLLFTYLLSLNVKFVSSSPSQSHPVLGFPFESPCQVDFDVTRSSSFFFFFFVLFVVVVFGVLRPLWFSFACLSSFRHE